VKSSGAMLRPAAADYYLQTDQGCRRGLGEPDAGDERVVHEFSRLPGE
jgi:hypothetical protein